MEKFVVFVIEADHGTAFHRLMMPSAALKNSGKNNIFIVQKADDFLSLDPTKIKAVVFSRLVAIPNHKAFKKYCDSYGIKIVVDLDDRWYLDYHIDKNNAHFYNNFSQVYIKETVKIADVIWAASPYLGKRISKELKVPENKVFYVPNGFDPEINNWSPTPTPDSNEPIFGYVAALGHQKDIGILKDAFNGKKLLTVKYDGADFSYGEYMGSTWKEEPPKGWGEYADFYDNIHVSIAPLAKTDFNMCKSSLKIQEAGFKKRAIICSDINLYNGIIKHNKNGILCSSRADWDSAIKSMTVEKAHDLGAELYETVKDDFNIHNINKTRWQSIFD